MSYFRLSSLPAPGVEARTKVLLFLLEINVFAEKNAFFCKKTD